MSTVVFLLLGAMLCFIGARSVRLTVTAAGIGAAALIAEALDASVTTTLVVGLAGGVLAFVMTLLLAKFVMLVVGGLVGAVVGAKFFAITGGDSWALALVFVPTVAVLGALLAERLQERFMMWGTAIAGAGLILSGIAQLGPEFLDAFGRPDNTSESLLLTGCWVLLIAGRQVQASRAQPSDT